MSASVSLTELSLESDKMRRVVISRLDELLETFKEEEEGNIESRSRAFERIRELISVGNQSANEHFRTSCLERLVKQCIIDLPEIPKVAFSFLHFTLQQMPSCKKTTLSNLSQIWYKVLDYVFATAADATWLEDLCIFISRIPSGYRTDEYLYVETWARMMERLVGFLHETIIKLIPHIERTVFESADIESVVVLDKRLAAKQFNRTVIALVFFISAGTIHSVPLHPLKKLVHFVLFLLESLTTTTTTVSGGEGGGSNNQSRSEQLSGSEKIVVRHMLLLFRILVKSGKTCLMVKVFPRFNKILAKMLIVIRDEEIKCEIVQSFIDEIDKFGLASGLDKSQSLEQAAAKDTVVLNVLTQYALDHLVVGGSSSSSNVFIKLLACIVRVYSCFLHAHCFSAINAKAHENALFNAQRQSTPAALNDLLITLRTVHVPKNAFRTSVRIEAALAPQSTPSSSLSLLCDLFTEQRMMTNANLTHHRHSGDDDDETDNNNEDAPMDNVQRRREQCVKRLTQTLCALVNNASSNNDDDDGDGDDESQVIEENDDNDHQSVLAAAARQRSDEDNKNSSSNRPKMLDDTHEFIVLSDSDCNSNGSKGKQQERTDNNETLKRKGGSSDGGDDGPENDNEEIDPPPVIDIEADDDGEDEDEDKRADLNDQSTCADVKKLKLTNEDGNDKDRDDESSSSTNALDAVLALFNEH